MPEIVQVTQGAVRVNAAAQLDNGTMYQTSVSYPSAESYEAMSPQERDQVAIDQISSELEQARMLHAQEVGECMELIQIIDQEMARVGVYTLEQAQAHEYWPVLSARGLLAVEAALRWAFSPVMLEESVVVWLEFAEVIAMVEIKGDPLEDFSFSSRVQQWRAWAADAQIEL